MVAKQFISRFWWIFNLETWMVWAPKNCQSKQKLLFFSHLSFRKILLLYLILESSQIWQKIGKSLWKYRLTIFGRKVDALVPTYPSQRLGLETYNWPISPWPTSCIESSKTYAAELMMGSPIGTFPELSNFPSKSFKEEKVAKVTSIISVDP